jgi:hypothetical protein
MTSTDGGLIQFSLSDTVATILQQLDMKNGVATNTFYAVYPDGLGSFWCSTDLGIVQLDTAQWSFQFYSTQDGIQNKEFNRLSHCTDEFGNIYFGGLNSVTGFDPSDFYPHNYVPINLSVLRLEQYSGWENKVVDRTRQFKETGYIRLAPGDNFFVMEVGLNDLFQTKQQQFQYKLDELGHEWYDVQGNRFRVYGLSYGTHMLEIRARNARGVSADNVLRMPVIVVRPVYLRWWFLVGLALVSHDS